MTTEGRAAFLPSSTNVVHARYNGKIKLASVKVVALCKADEADLSPNIKRIFRISGLYEVPLGTVPCNPQQVMKAKKITVYYNGNGGSACLYE